MNNKKIGFLLIIFITFISVGFSQRSISGIIQEAGSGERLSYSNVYIDSIKIGSSANENGFFTLIGDIKKGMVLKASYVGYKSQSIILTDSLINNEIEINLIALTSTLNEVVVSAESSKFLQASSEISKHKMSVKQLSLMPSIGEVDISLKINLCDIIQKNNRNEITVSKYNENGDGFPTDFKIKLAIDENIKDTD